jgi:hypothetical protein
MSSSYERKKEQGVAGASEKRLVKGPVGAE